MATTKQVKSARSSMQKARPAARSQRTIPQQSSSARSAFPKQRASAASSKRASSSQSAIPRQGSSVASSKRIGSSLKTRAELYELARKRDLPGRSRMGRQELASKLGVR